MKDILLKRIANTLVVNIQNVDNRGLFNGKTGIAVFLYYYARYSGISVYSDVADDLIEDISNSLNSTGSVDFETGLTGIGWGFQHLLDNQFVEGDADDILSDVDEHIFKNISKKKLMPVSSEIHWFGHGLYFLSREKKRALSKEKAEVFKLMLDSIDGILEHDDSRLSISFLNSVLYFLVESSTDTAFVKQKQDIIEKTRKRISAIESKYMEKTPATLEDYANLCRQNILYHDAQSHFKKEKIDFTESMINEVFENYEMLSTIGLNILL